MAYTEKENVLDKAGVTEADLTEGQLDRIITEAEAEVDRIIKTTCKAITKVELLEGNDSRQLTLTNIPLINVLALEIDSTTITASKVSTKEDGRVILKTNAEQQHFLKANDPDNIKIKYQYGWLEETDTQTTLSSASTAGSDVELSVGSEKGFQIGEYVLIQGFDGNKEAAKITAVGTGTITVNLLSQTHESGSLITLMEVPSVVSKLTAVIGGIMTALYMVGATYTFATSYSIPDYSVTKGVPYPHFAKVIDNLTKERDHLMELLPKWPIFA